MRSPGPAWSAPTSPRATPWRQSPGTEEKRLLPTPDALVRWLVLVEGVDREAVEAACAALLSPETLSLHGAAGPVAVGLYQLHLVIDPHR